ncbi:MAG: hypothetical protein JWO36_6548 [Myxococcales bacterium]|nr:hypothetical protein [Myxococcales bacterium]
MTKLVHLHRYAAKKKSAEVANIEIAGEGAVIYNGSRYDLRTGQKQGAQTGFRFTLDGRYLAWDDGALTIHDRNNTVVRAEAKGSISTMLFVGKWLVVSDDGRKPFLVLDAATGAALGRIEGQKPDGPVYNPAIFDPQDGRTLWLGEGARLAQVDIGERRVVREIAAPADHRFFGVAALKTGHVMTIVRRRALKFDSSADRLAVFDPSGKMASIDGTAMSLGRLGSRFLTSDSRNKCFAIYDTKLELEDAVPMFEPAKDAYSRVLPLPSGREWVAVGGYGEWDHYGPTELGPQKLEAEVNGAGRPARPPKRPAAKVASKKSRKSSK